MLEVARDRTPDADLRVGEIQALPYDDASFDVVTAFNSIQYAADPAAAVAVLRAAVAAGVNHIDTSDFYGPHVTNQLIRQAQRLAKNQYGKYLLKLSKEKVHG